MDLGILGAIALLVIWAVAALVMEGPGWVNLFLTLGVFLIIYRVVVRSTPDAPKDPTGARRDVQSKGRRGKG